MPILVEFELTLNEGKDSIGLGGIGGLFGLPCIEMGGELGLIGRVGLFDWGGNGGLADRVGALGG